MAPDFSTSITTLSDFFQNGGMAKSKYISILLAHPFLASRLSAT